MPIRVNKLFRLLFQIPKCRGFQLAIVRFRQLSADELVEIVPDLYAAGKSGINEKFRRTGGNERIPRKNPHIKHKLFRPLCAHQLIDDVFGDRDGRRAG